MHIGKRSDICPDIYIDTWEVKCQETFKVDTMSTQGVHCRYTVSYVFTSSLQERGDLFSMQHDYLSAQLNLEDPNILLAARAQLFVGICKDISKSSAIYEAFQDSVDKRAKDAGIIF